MSFPRCLVVVLSFAFLVGCINLKQPSYHIDYFALEYEPRPAGNLNPLPHVLKVNRFRAAPVYNTTQMIYRDRPFKREAYTYHKWRTNPGDLVSSLLARDIQRSGLFKAVVSHESRLSVSYVLEGSVDEFLESNREGVLQAVLTVSTTLMAAGERDLNKSVLFQETFHAAEPCKEKGPQALAEAMSEAMAQVSQEIIRSLYNHLKDR
jgi:ABC-type uncharacterized transport system auxiliary subunit